MRLRRTSIAGVYVVELAPIEDERGFFARSYCTRTFEEAGLEAVTAQANIAFNRRAGTVRGLHYQVPPHGEAKLVRCTRGRVFDVAVDLRGGSPTYLQHVGLELDPEARRALYVPAGCAHGYVTMSDDSEVTYQVSAYYAPGAEGGLRWDDPRLAIPWPTPVAVSSDKDAAWPLIDEVGAPAL